MPALTFSKWSPGGNTTLLFPDSGQRPAEQARLAALQRSPWRRQEQLLAHRIAGGVQLGAGLVDGLVHARTGCFGGVGRMPGVGCGRGVVAGIDGGIVAHAKAPGRWWMNSCARHRRADVGARHSPIWGRRTPLQAPRARPAAPHRAGHFPGRRRAARCADGAATPCAAHPGAAGAGGGTRCGGAGRRVELGAECDGAGRRSGCSAEQRAGFSALGAEQYVNSEYLEGKEFNLEGKKRFYAMPEGVIDHKVGATRMQMVEREKGVGQSVIDNLFKETMFKEVQRLEYDIQNFS